MNIFYALSEGRGRLTETNLSAFLAYLLTPHAPHGLGDTFLRGFLEEMAQGCGDAQRFRCVLERRTISAQVGLEVRYDGTVARIVDIDLQIFDNASTQKKLHHIIIENKIKTGAAQADQLKDQFEGVMQALRQEEPCPVTVVFLTPPGDARVLQTEFDTLQLDASGANTKVWLRWRGVADPSVPRTVVDLIRELLRREASAEIEPVTDYTRHTLKAFVQFLERVIQSSAPTIRVADPEADDVLMQREVSLDGVRYLIVRYRSDAIKVFDLDSDSELAAHPLLRKVNGAYRLEIPLERSPGKPINTRQLGRKVLDALDPDR
ncbi:PD-(D/E)XK nuclease family protein [Caballeronia sp. LjRoot31]|uniref:PD-(D/E)XK nuclease family protein n=1 Tax=Caballeronia sp. LjRoot31 TaxID=3342324 RepID=UPI003ECFB684